MSGERATALASARFQWEEGLRRLREDDGLLAPRRSIIDAVRVELRRRLGQTFTLQEIADVYDGAQEWYLDLASRIAPRDPDAWDPAAALDAAFALHARGAADARR
ncbi:MAG: hypothetical protein ACR2N6_00145 [Miltoncostaeaceae bacterium]